MRELNEMELEEVSGGISRSIGYQTSLGAAGGFLALAVGASALTPVGIGLMAGASIFSSGLAIYYAAR